MEKYTNYKNISIDERDLKELKQKAKNDEAYNFAVRLRTCLLKKELNQIQVVNDTKIGSATISSYINAESEPKITNLLKLSKYLGVSVNYLLGEHENATATNEDIMKLLGLTDEAISNLNELKDYKFDKGDFLTTVNGGTTRTYMYIKNTELKNIDILNILLTKDKFNYEFLQLFISYYKEQYAKKIELDNNSFGNYNEEVRDLTVFKMQNILVKVFDEVSSDILKDLTER